MTALHSRRALFAAGGLLVAAGAVVALRVPAAAAPFVRVYKDPHCGCCQAWADRLVSAGFRVDVVAHDDMAAVKRAAGVPDDLASCHTATVEGYTVEGHVPPEDVHRLLRERPPIAGLAVPGMPIGSPGMEVPGRGAEPFDTIAFERGGARSVFRSHRPRTAR